MLTTILTVGAILAFVFVWRTRAQFLPGSFTQDALTGNQKLYIWLLCLMSPVLAGSIFYYSWRKVAPQKAKTANRISWSALLILVAFWYGMIYFFDFNPLGLSTMEKLNEKVQDNQGGTKDIASARSEDYVITTNLYASRMHAETYYEGNKNSYDGLCDDYKFKAVFDTSPNIGERACNDSISEFAVAFELNSGGYSCVDSTGGQYEIASSIGDKTSCASSDEEKQAYTNAEFGISFTPPLGWQKIVDNSKPSLLVMYGITNEAGDIVAKMSIFGEQLGSSITSDSYPRLFQEMLLEQNNDADLSSIEKIKSDVPTYGFTESYPLASGQLIIFKYIIKINKGNAFFIEVATTEAGWKEYGDVMNTSLATFTVR